MTPSKIDTVIKDLPPKKSGPDSFIAEFYQNFKEFLKRFWIQGAYLKIIKIDYSEPIANTNLNGEKFKTKLLKSGIR